MESGDALPMARDSKIPLHLAFVGLCCLWPVPDV